MNEHDRRERKEFEPPPWERDEFDRFQEERRREEQAAAEAAAREREAREREAEAEAAAAVMPAEEAPSTEGVPATSQVADEDAAPSASPPAGPSEAEALELMMGLRAEEPSVRQQYRTLNSVVSGVLMVLGAGIALVGLVRAVQTAEAGMTAFVMGSLTVFAGLIPLSAGAWLWWRNRQRG